MMIIVLFMVIRSQRELVITPITLAPKMTYVLQEKIPSLFNRFHAIEGTYTGRQHGDFFNSSLYISEDLSMTVNFEIDEHLFESREIFLVYQEAFGTYEIDRAKEMKVHVYVTQAYAKENPAIIERLAYIRQIDGFYDNHTNDRYQITKQISYQDLKNRGINTVTYDPAKQMIDLGPYTFAK